MADHSAGTDFTKLSFLFSVPNLTFVFEMAASLRGNNNSNNQHPAPQRQVEEAQKPCGEDSGTGDKTNPSQK